MPPPSTPILYFPFVSILECVVSLGTFEFSRVLSSRGKMTVSLFRLVSDYPPRHLLMTTVLGWHLTFVTVLGPGWMWLENDSDGCWCQGRYKCIVASVRVLPIEIVLGREASVTERNLHKTVISRIGKIRIEPWFLRCMCANHRFLRRFCYDVCN